MTYIKSLSIWCDGGKLEEGRSEDCKLSYGKGVAYETVTAVREDAHQRGWVTRGAEDYCPYCK